MVNYISQKNSINSDTQGTGSNSTNARSLTLHVFTERVREKLDDLKNSLVI